MKRLLPVWFGAYRREWLAGDLSAGLIAAVMLVPQSLGYAMLAGLPPEVGLYASILPVIAYAWLGSSMTLAVGPVAVASLMTASALHPLAVAGSAHYVMLAGQLALLSGLMLLAFGVLRLGFLAHFLSHPVVSGFLSGSSLLIAVGQFKHVLGVKVEGHGMLETTLGLVRALPDTNRTTLLVGGSTLAFLWVARRWFPGWFRRAGLSPDRADLAARFAPMLAVIVWTSLTALLELDRTSGLAVVGQFPSGLPTFPGWDALLPSRSVLADLALPALLLALVGFVESVSMAQSLAQRRQQRILPDRELLGLGAANLASAVSGSYPIIGGLSRSVINYAAGAQSPLASVVSALLMVLILLFFSSLFHPLPHAVLAAAIIVAVSSLIDVQAFRRAWAYDRADGMSLIASFVGVLVFGVEAGIVIGVSLSLAVIVWRSSHPHIAVVGRVLGTEHFRNINRHRVDTLPGVLAIRVDESLFFANAMEVESRIEALLAADDSVNRVVISCAGVNQVDTTALHMLTTLETDLARRGIRLDLAEVKGPVMDRLRDTEFGIRVADRVYLSLHDAMAADFKPPVR